MTYPLKYPEFEAVENRLLWLMPLVSVSYIHGVICACVCKHDKDFLDDFFVTTCKELQAMGAYINEEFAQDYQALVNELYTITYGCLNDDDMIFQLFLPNDDEDILYRFQSLVDWILGFLDALKIHLTNFELSDDAKEAIANIEEITTIDLTEITEDEEYEKYYVNFIEYARVAILYLNLELPKK